MYDELTCHFLFYSCHLTKKTNELSLHHTKVKILIFAHPHDTKFSSNGSRQFVVFMKKARLLAGTLMSIKMSRDRLFKPSV